LVLCPLLIKFRFLLLLLRGRTGSLGTIIVYPAPDANEDEDPDGDPPRRGREEPLEEAEDEGLLPVNDNHDG
jgi:hypothetical protein